MRTTSRPAWAPERRYQTLSWARPQSERGSLVSSVAPTVVPGTVAGRPATDVGVARLSLAGGPADRAAAAVAGTMRRKATMAMTVACLRCLLIASLLAGGHGHHLAGPQRGRHALVTVLRHVGAAGRRAHVADLTAGSRCRSTCCRGRMGRRSPASARTGRPSRSR